MPVTKCEKMEQMFAQMKQELAGLKTRNQEHSGNPNWIPCS